MGWRIFRGALRPARVGLLICATATGCATGAAQRAFDRGDYPAAASMADDSLRANPSDARMPSLRQAARDRFADAEITRIRGFRAGKHGDAALAEMDRLLKQLHGWGGREALSPATRSALDAELTAATALVEGPIDGDLAAGRALSAELAFARLAPLLAHPELAPAREAATAKIRAKGREACERLQKSATVDGPHWVLTVHRYCDHFGVADGASAPSATEPRPFELTGGVKGMKAEQVAALRARVTAWLRASLWNDPLPGPSGGSPAPPLGRGSIEGTVESSFRRQTVTLHESYEDKITTTGFVSLGNKSGVALGTTTMDREFPYEAEEIRGHYGMNVTVRLDVGASAPVTLKLTRVEDTKSYEHDVTFEPAGISPRRDRVLSTEEWVNAQLDSFATRVTWALNRKFVRTYCGRPQYSLEEAARCLVAGVKPAAAMATLTLALGENAEAAAELLRSAPPPPENPSQARAKPNPPRPPRDLSEADEDPIAN